MLLLQPGQLEVLGGQVEHLERARQRLVAHFSQPAGGFMCAYQATPTAHCEQHITKLTGMPTSAFAFDSHGVSKQVLQDQTFELHFICRWRCNTFLFAVKGVTICVACACRS